MALADIDLAPREVRAFTPAKILTFDIERRPRVVFEWDKKDRYTSKDKEIIRSSTISWAAKWYHEDETMFASISRKRTMFTRPEDTPGYRRMLQRLRDLLDQADIVVGYNSRRFDEAKIRGELVRLGIPEPSPFRTLDLFNTTKRMSWDYSSLAETAEAVGIPPEEGKTAHQGFRLWVDCMNGDPEAWALMETYNRQDVVLTERVMDRLRPYIKDHPNLGLWAGTDDLGRPVPVCSKCGSGDLHLTDADASTPLTRFPAFKCGNCGTSDQRNLAARARVEIRTAR